MSRSPDKQVRPVLIVGERDPFMRETLQAALGEDYTPGGRHGRSRGDGGEGDG